MNLSQKEKLLREQRTNEAMKKRMMGSAGKLGTIVKWLGSPIMRQGGGMVDQTLLEDVWEIPREEEIPLAEDDSVVHEGWVFDGLRFGVHIEIKYIELDKTLTCDFKGYRVYTEIAGELYSYAPFSDWEEPLEKLYRFAVEKKEKTAKAMEPIEALEMATEKKNILQRLRLRWGI